MTADRNMNPAELLGLARGFVISQALYTVTVLGVPDVLRTEPTSIGNIARAVKADPDALYRIMRALASVGIFWEEEERSFRLTPLAEYLLQNEIPTLRNVTIMSGSAWHWRAWGAMLYSARTGRPAFEAEFGTQFFDYLAGNKSALAEYCGAMNELTRLINSPALALYSFADTRLVVDIGGGDGILLANLLANYPDLKGILLELPPVATRARSFIQKSGISDRCAVLEGSFFDDIPRGGDVYILCRILHDWDDDHALQILRQCREAMMSARGSRLIILEETIEIGNQRQRAKFVDLEMLVLAGGRERTINEYENLLTQVGFSISSVLGGGGPMQVIEANSSE